MIPLSSVVRASHRARAGLLEVFVPFTAFHGSAISTHGKTRGENISVADGGTIPTFQHVPNGNLIRCMRQCSKSGFAATFATGATLGRCSTLDADTGLVLCVFESLFACRHLGLLPLIWSLLIMLWTTMRRSSSHRDLVSLFACTCQPPDLKPPDCAVHHGPTLIL